MLLTLVITLGLIAWSAARDDAKSSSMGNVGHTADLVLPPIPQKQTDIRAFIVETMGLDDPDEMLERAKQLRTKLPETAREIARRAQRLSQNANLCESPFEGVSDYRWTKFVRAIATGKPKVSSTNHIGLFMFAYPRLVELDAATNLRKDDKGRHLADLTLSPEMSMEEFLASPEAQYKVFEGSMEQYNGRLNPLRRYIGQSAEGKKITWSGLLGIAHRAGITGLKSWLENPGERSRFPNTTSTFLKTTEVF